MLQGESTAPHGREPQQAAVKASLQKACYLSCNIITRKSQGTGPIPRVSVVSEYSSGPGTRPKPLQELWGQSSAFRCQNSLKILLPQSLRAHPKALVEATKSAPSFWMCPRNQCPSSAQPPASVPYSEDYEKGPVGAKKHLNGNLWTGEPLAP